MKYIIMELNADTLGTQEIHYYAVPDDVTEKEINEKYTKDILDHASNYGYDYLDWAYDTMDDYIEDEDEDWQYWSDYETTVYEFGYWDYLDAKPAEDEMDDSLYGLEPWEHANVKVE